MKHPYVDCQGLAGAWTLGTIQTGGFELVHRASLGKFGDQLIDDNRHLVGYDWEQDDADGAHDWTPVTCAYLNGTPPCSGFSLLNVAAAKARKHGQEPAANARGAGSSINSCMWELVHYAARCTGTDGLPGPQVVSFESVQGAGKEGRGLMQELRYTLELETGQDYGLSHVFMSGSTVGAAQMRHRYYVVFHRIPFGVDRPQPRRVCSYRDAIGDLQGLKLQWEDQPLNGSTWWLVEQKMQRADGMVDAHVTYDDSVPSRSLYTQELLPYWRPGEGNEHPMRRYLEAHGVLPERAARGWDYERNTTKGFGGPRMIDPKRPGYVLTGGGVGDFVHWAEPRFITVREAARLMGYPDTWSFRVATGVNQASSWIGKCCPVTSGRWISERVLAALEGEPEAPLEPLGEREDIFNCTLDYKRWDKSISHLEGVK